MTRKLMYLGNLVSILLLCGCTSDVGFKETKSVEIMKYNSYESVAIDSLDVLTVYNAESYESTKEKLKTKVTGKILNEYFPTSEFRGIDIERPNISILNIGGDMYSDNDSITYKINISYSIGNNGTYATMLVTVKNGIVESIERI